MSEAATAQQLWWILAGGAPTGPYAQVDLIGHLQQGNLTPDTPACPVGSTQWAPLGSWSPFHEPVAAETRDTYVEPPPVVGPRSTGQRRVSPPLPEFASWICVYALFVSPALWLLGWMIFLGSPSLFLEASPLFGVQLFVDLVSAAIGLSTTLLLLVGALQLRKLRQSGVTLLTWGLGIDLGWLLVNLILLVLMLMEAASDPEFVHLRPDEGSSAGLSWLQAAIGLTALVFEIVAFIWLLRRGGQLPLRN